MNSQTSIINHTAVYYSLPPFGICMDISLRITKPRTFLLASIVSPDKKLSSAKRLC